jgi:beta-lactamase class A
VSGVGALTALTVLALSMLAAEGATPSPARTRSGSANPFASPSLRAYLTARGTNVTAAAYDINTGRTYLSRPGVREETASIVKLDILATLLREEQGRGGLSAEETGLAAGMIETSDNDDATALWNLEGGAPAVLAFDRAAGMGQTTPNAYWGHTTTTARDQLRLLRRIMLPNRLLTRSSRRYAYELMRHVIPSERWGVSAGAGPRATVALKNGWFPRSGGGWQVNSIGEVAGSGRRYLLAVMTGRDPTEQYGIDTIERISVAAWRALRLRTLDGFTGPVSRRVA